jgi:hypothetical protein
LSAIAAQVSVPSFRHRRASALSNENETQMYATECALTAVRNGQRRRLSAQRIFKLPNKQLKLSNRRYAGSALKRLHQRLRRRHVSCSSLPPIRSLVAATAVPRRLGK